MRAAAARDLTDAELMASTARGDRDAFGALVERHRRQVLSVALRLTGSRADAEDVAQDAFVLAFVHAGSYDESRGEVAAWLLRIARNTALDRMRRRYRRDERLDAAAHVADGVDSHATVEEGQRRARLAAAIDALPAPLRSVTLLVPLGGLQCREAAAVLGWPMGTVLKRLWVARGKLRESIAEAAA